MNESIKSIKLSDYFCDIKSNTFVRFTKKHNKLYIGDITIGDVIDYRSYYGVTELRYNHFIKKLYELDKNIKNENNNILGIKNNIIENVSIEDELSEIEVIYDNLDEVASLYGNNKVSDLFGDIAFNSFRTFLYKRHIFNIKQITNNDLYDFLEYNASKAKEVNTHLESIIERIKIRNKQISEEESVGNPNNNNKRDIINNLDVEPENNLIKGSQSNKVLLYYTPNDSQGAARYSIIDFNNFDDLEYTKPVAAYYYEKKLKNISSWKDVYVNLFKEIYKDYSDYFRINTTFGSGERLDLTDGVMIQNMISPKRIEENLYLETNLSSKDTIRKIKFILDRIAIDYSDIIIKYEIRKNKHKIEIKDGDNSVINKIDEKPKDVKIYTFDSNKSNKLDSIKNNYNNLTYNIKKENEYDYKQNIKDNNKSLINIKSEDEVILEEYSKILNNIIDYNKKVKIKYYFKNPKFPSFAGYLNIKKKEYIGEITVEDLIEYIDIYNLDDTKIVSFKNLFIKLSQNRLLQGIDTIRSYSENNNIKNASKLESDKSTFIPSDRKNEIAIYSRINILDYNIDKIKKNYGDNKNKNTELTNDYSNDLAEIEEVLSDLNTDFKTINLYKYFHEIEFSEFREFLDKNNFRLLGDLDAKDLLNFKNKNYFNDNNFHMLLNKIKDLSHRDIKLYGKTTINEPIFYYNRDYFDLDDIKVNSVLDYFGLGDRFLIDLKFKDLYNKKINKTNFYLNEIDLISKINSKLSNLKGPNEILEDFFNEITENYKEYFYYRYKNNGISYETIAKQYNLNEDLIKDIVENTIKQKLIDHLIINNFKLSVYLNLAIYDILSIGIVSYECLEDLFEEKYKHIINFIISIGEDKNNSTEGVIFYYEKYRLFFKDNERRKKFINEINIIEQNIPSILDLNSPPAIFDLNYFESGTLTIEEFLIYNGYYKNGNIFSKENLSLEDIIIYYLKNKADSIKIDEESFGDFKKIINDEYDISIDSSFKTIKQIVNVSENLLEVGYGYVSLFDLNHYDLDNIDKCYKYYLDHKNRNIKISIEEIYETYRNDLQLDGIINETHLTSIMRILYDDI